MVIVAIMHSRVTSDKMPQSKSSIFPVNKRPRVGTSPHRPHASLASKKNVLMEGVDPFDDCFTGEELLELEMVASQVENNKPTNSVFNNAMSSTSGAVQFKAPQRTFNNTATSVNVMQDHDSIIQRLEERCSYYQLKISQLTKDNEQRSGEARLLRDKVNDAERVLHEERQAKVLVERAKKEEKSQREMELEKRVESYKDQVDFKQAELQEAQQMIRNLEMKNKEQTHNNSVWAKSAQFSTQDFSETLSQKKIKLIKPRSPRIYKLKATKDPPNDENQVSDNPSQQDNSLQKRQACRLHSPKGNIQGIIPPLLQPDQQVVWCNLLTLLKSYSRSDDSLLDGMEAGKHLLHIAYWRDKSAILKQASTVMKTINSTLNMFFKMSLQDPDVTEANPQQKEHVVTCLEVACILLEIVDGLNLLFQNDDVTSTLRHYADDEDDSITTACLKVFVSLSKNCSSDKTKVFIPLVSKMKLLISGSNFSKNSLVVDFLTNFLRHSDVIELVVTRSIDEEPSLLSSVCRVCLEECGETSSWAHFVNKAIGFITSLVSRYDVTLSQHHCFAEIYHTTSLVTFRLLTSTERSRLRESLISKCLCLLHSCINSHPNGIPGLHRDHKHILLVWKLRTFLESQESTYFNEELKQLLSRDIAALEKV